MRRALIFMLVLGAAPVEAAQFDFAGYADFRVIAPATSERGWTDGGLGKLRYGKGDSAAQFGGASGQGSVLLTPELLIAALARIDPSVTPGADLLEAYVRYRPVSTTRWRWSVKGGAFFAPFSLENTEIGWAPYWTLTSSAINSWYGDELRTIGAEATVEWRGTAGTLSLIGAAIGGNEPAGAIMADRGWALGDRPTGLFQELRIPDATLLLHHDTPPDTTPIFAQFDNQIGVYAGGTWKPASGWRLEVFRYDNEANPSAHKDDYFAWRTRFWNAGLSRQMGAFMLLGQVVSGDTTIAPSSTFRSTTDFDSAFLLLGWERDDWRIAARAEEFHTRSHNSFGPSPATSEYGCALTLAVSWLPNDWTKLTAEMIALNSTRGERMISHLAPRRSDTQLQLAARFYVE